MVLKEATFTYHGNEEIEIEIPDGWQIENDLPQYFKDSFMKYNWEITSIDFRDKISNQINYTVELGHHAVSEDNIVLAYCDFYMTFPISATPALDFNNDFTELLFRNVYSGRTAYMWSLDGIISEVIKHYTLTNTDIKKNISPAPNVSERDTINQIKADFADLKQAL